MKNRISIMCLFLLALFFPTSEIQMAKAGPDEEEIQLRLKLKPGEQYAYDTVCRGAGWLHQISEEATLKFPGTMEFRQKMVVHVEKVADNKAFKLRVYYPQIWNEGTGESEGLKSSWKSFYDEGKYLHQSFDAEGQEIYRKEKVGELLVDMEKGVLYSTVNPYNELLSSSAKKGYENKLGPHRTFYNEFLIFSKDSVALGDTWSGSVRPFEYTAIVADSMRLKLTYTLHDIVIIENCTVATINVQGSKEWKDEVARRSFPQDPYEHIIEWEYMKQSYKGFYKIDVNTGLILDSKLSLAIEGKYRQKYKYQGHDGEEQEDPNQYVEEYNIIIIRKPWKDIPKKKE